MQWMNHCHRTLICGIVPDPEMTAPGAHHSCLFGTWYRNLDTIEHQPWLSHLKQIDRIHRNMHETVAKLVHGRPDAAVLAEDYDRFADHAYRFRTGIRSLQMKLIRDVCLVDHLTGVWNRSSLIQRLSEEYDRVIRHGYPCCLCMMDLDYFKTINDRYGHAVGDQVLQVVAGIARQRLRRYDSIFRYGGEEFLFCLPKASIADAVASMERVLADISGTPIPLDSGDAIHITASFGVAELSLLVSIEESIEAADQALFRAKTSGRNKVCST